MNSEKVKLAKLIFISFIMMVMSFGQLKDVYQVHGFVLFRSVQVSDKLEMPVQAAQEPSALQQIGVINRALSLPIAGDFRFSDVASVFLFLLLAISFGVLAYGICKMHIESKQD